MSPRSREPDSVGIIGYGRLGSTLARLLAPHYSITAYDPYANVPRPLRVESMNELVCGSDLVIITVGPNALDGVISELASAAAECGVTGVAESSSFKRGNIEKLTVLPDGVATAGIHPMFGHGVRSTRGHSVIVTPVPGRDDGGHELFKDLFERAGFRTIVLDSDEHDRIMGVVLGLPYAISLALDKIIGENPNLYYESSGTTFKALFTAYATSLSQQDLALELVGRPESKSAIRILAEALLEIADGVFESRGDREQAINSDLFYKALYCLVEECLGQP